MDVPQYWSYSEPSRIDTVAERWAELRCQVDELMGVSVGKAEDDAAEQARIQEEQHKRAQELFEALKRDVENQRKK